MHLHFECMLGALRLRSHDRRIAPLSAVAPSDHLQSLFDRHLESRQRSSEISIADRLPGATGYALRASSRLSASLFPTPQCGFGVPQFRCEESLDRVDIILAESSYRDFLPTRPSVWSNTQVVEGPLLAHVPQRGLLPSHLRFVDRHR